MTIFQLLNDAIDQILVDMNDGKAGWGTVSTDGKAGWDTYNSGKAGW